MCWKSCINEEFFYSLQTKRNIRCMFVNNSIPCDDIWDCSTEELIKREIPWSDTKNHSSSVILDMTSNLPRPLFLKRGEITFIDHFISKNSFKIIRIPSDKICGITQSCFGCAIEHTHFNRFEFCTFLVSFIEKICHTKEKCFFF